MGITVVDHRWVFGQYTDPLKLVYHNTCTTSGTIITHSVSHNTPSQTTIPSHTRSSSLTHYSPPPPPPLTQTEHGWRAYVKTSLKPPQPTSHTDYR